MVHPTKEKNLRGFFIIYSCCIFHGDRDELADLIGSNQTGASKFFEFKITYQLLLIVTEQSFNKMLMQCLKPLNSLEIMNLVTCNTYDSLNDQENSDIESDLESDVLLHESFHEQLPEHLAQSLSAQSNQPPDAIVAFSHLSNISDDLLRESVRSLNSKQRPAFNTVLTWCRTKMIQNNSKHPNEMEPLPISVCHRRRWHRQKSLHKNNLSYCSKNI